MPAMAPLLRPLLLDEAPPLLFDPAVGALVADAVIVTGCREAVATIGSETPLHRLVVFENTQHESVAFGELIEQYEQSPPRLSV